MGDALIVVSLAWLRTGRATQSILREIRHRARISPELVARCAIMRLSDAQM